MKIKNSVAIVSGGASGMGAATAKILSQAGAKVAIFDLNMDKAEKLATEIKGLSLACDITAPLDLEKSINEVNKTWEPARIWVNCAGIINSKRMVGKDGPMPLEEFRHIIEVNLIGTFNFMRLAASNMISLEPRDDSSERGIIINTASIAAFEGQIGQTAYSASKGGVTSLTLPAARELAQFGIRVVTIAPGLIDTPMFEKLHPEARKNLIDAIPFPKRLGYPKEYAQLVAHIIDNQMINGTVVRLDGALRMQAK